MSGRRTARQTETDKVDSERARPRCQAVCQLIHSTRQQLLQTPPPRRRCCCCCADDALTDGATRHCRLGRIALSVDSTRVKAPHALDTGATYHSSNTAIVSTCVSILYTVSQKTVQNCFCQNFVEFPPTLIIFGTLIAKGIYLCEVQLFSFLSK